MMLRDSGRWEDRAVCCVEGSREIVVVAIFHGSSGAANDAEKFRRNEELLAKALVRMMTVGDVPYFLGAEMNVNPEESRVVAGLIERGCLVDLPAHLRIR